MKTIVIAGVLSLALAPAQTRPRLIGLSHIAVRVKDLNTARQFYGGVLGYQEAFTVRRDGGAVLGGGLPQDEASQVFFKVNNRQYIVVAPETSASQPRFVNAGVETDDAEEMRMFLKSSGYAVPDKVNRTPTKNLAFTVQDPDGNTYEIEQYTPESLSVQTLGKFLSDERASDRILHVGVTITKPPTVDFYLKGFSLREFWRADTGMSAPGRSRTPSAAPVLASLSNLKLPESDDYIEWSLVHGEPGTAQGRAHIALLVPDAAKAVAFVKSKPAWKNYSRAAEQESHVGINHKWQANFFDPDGTRSEFMEHDTADGLPSPMSRAPYFR